MINEWENSINLGIFVGASLFLAWMIWSFV